MSEYTEAQITQFQSVINVWRYQNAEGKRLMVQYINENAPTLIEEFDSYFTELDPSDE
jgi:hypothetical protein